MQLILSDILLPKDRVGTWLRGLSLPGLEALIKRSDSARMEAPTPPDLQRITPPIRALLRHYAYPVNADQAALAPLLMLADGLMPGHQVWHVLSPAHYALARDHVILGQTPLSWEKEKDWQVLAQVAGEIFAAAGGQFIAHHAQRWYWQHPLAQGLLSSMPARALGRNVDIWMPGGDEQAARFWRRLHNELQMTWHEHRVNHTREQQGLPVANGVWLQGSGALPPTPIASRTDTTEATLPLLQQGLQRWAGAQDVQFIENLSLPYAQQDAHAWRTTLEKLDAEVFLPMAHSNDRLVLILCGEHTYRECQIATTGWKFWLKRWRQAHLERWLSV